MNRSGGGKVSSKIFEGQTNLVERYNVEKIWSHHEISLFWVMSESQNKTLSTSWMKFSFYHKIILISDSAIISKGFTIQVYHFALPLKLIMTKNRIVEIF